MIVIDNNKKIRVNLQGKSSCQHNKICGHSFLLIRRRQIFVRGTMIKKNAPDFSIFKKFVFFKRKFMYSFAKGKLAVNFSFVQRSSKRLSVAE